MKNLIILSTLIFLSVLGNTFAKTQGHYVDFNIIRTDLSALYNVYSTSGASNSYSKSDNSEFRGIGDDDKISVGIAYKYAYNFDNGIYVAPIVFFDYSNVKAGSYATSLYKYKLDYRYGIKTNLGYDITDKFSLYSNMGVAYNKYEVRQRPTSTAKNSSVDPSFLYGFGTKYSIAENVDLNFELELSKVTMEEPRSASVGIYTSGKTRFNTRTLRFGLSYRF